MPHLHHIKNRLACFLLAMLLPAAGLQAHSKGILPLLGPDGKTELIPFARGESYLVLSATGHDFGDVEIGDSAAQTITVDNAGDEALTVAVLGVGGGVTASPATFAVAPLATGVPFTITWVPTATGPLSQTLTLSVTHAGGTEPELIPVHLTGEAIEGPVLLVTIDGFVQSTWDFGETVRRQGQSDIWGEKAVTVTNTGDRAFSDLAVTGPGGVGYQGPGDLLCGTNGDWCSRVIEPLTHLAPGASADYMIGYSNGAGEGHFQLTYAFAGDGEQFDLTVSRTYENHLTYLFGDGPETERGDDTSGGDGTNPLLANGARGFKGANAFVSSLDDHINTINGNLVVPIPIGPVHRVGSFTYGLTLVHNAKAWSSVLLSESTQGTGLTETPYTVPYQQSNAGLSWQILPGGMLYPPDPEANLGTYNWPNTTNHWLYVGEDGAFHELLEANGGQPTSHDGAFIRLSDGPGTTKVVEFPDGRKYTFERDNGPMCEQDNDLCYRIVKMHDQYGGTTPVNFVDVSYTTAPETMVLQDSIGRVTTIHFTEAYGANSSQLGSIQRMITRVDVPAVGGGTATYTLTYRDAPSGTQVSRQCPVDLTLFDDYPHLVGTMTLPVLERLDLPGNNGSYTFDFGGLDQGTCFNGSGMLKEVVLPSRAVVKYKYGYWELPAPCSIVTPAPPDTIEDRTQSFGVLRRGLFKEGGGVEISYQQYSPVLGERGIPVDQGPACNRDNLLTTTVFHGPPLDAKTRKEIYYHTVTLEEENIPPGVDWERTFYGLPIAKNLTQGTGNERVYLSQDTQVCNGQGAGCVSKRKTYLRYAVAEGLDSIGVASCNRWSPQACFSSDQIVTRRREEFENGSFRTTVYGAYDGIGHTRAVKVDQTQSNFAKNFTRITHTHYDRVSGSVAVADETIPWIDYPNGSWLLNLVGYRSVQELDRKARTEYQQDRDTGFVECKRAHVDTDDDAPIGQLQARRVQDQLVIYTPNADGTVASERWYGFTYTTVKNTLETTHGSVTRIKHDATTLADLAYHANRMVRTIAHGNGVTDTLDLDANGMDRYASISIDKQAATYWSRGPFTYDGAGNILSTGVESYNYDNLSRLTFGTHAGGSESYSYDAFGNHTSGLGAGISVNPLNNRIEASPVEYDSAGRVIEYGCVHMSYDELGLRMGWSCHSGDPADYQYRAVYYYNALGQRIVVHESAVEVPDNRILISIPDADGNPMRDFLISGSSKQAKDYFYVGARLVAIDDGTGLKHVHLDHLGSPRVFTTANGQLDSVLSYKPYGGLVPDDQNPSGEHITFTGHIQDSTSASGSGFKTGHGLTHHMKAREYFGPWRRFLTPDPAHDGWSLYAYAGNNPITVVDPTGLRGEGYMEEQEAAHAQSDRIQLPRVEVQEEPLFSTPDNPLTIAVSRTMQKAPVPGGDKSLRMGLEVEFDLDTGLPSNAGMTVQATFANKTKLTPLQFSIKSDKAFIEGGGFRFEARLSPIEPAGGSASIFARNSLVEADGKGNVGLNFSSFESYGVKAKAGFSVRDALNFIGALPEQSKKIYNNIMSSIESRINF